MGRMQRVNEQVKREIGMIIQRELSDPRLGFVTITGAQVSPDLKYAKIFFSVLGGTKELENAKNGLNSAKSMIRRILGANLTIRYTPELEFLYDDSIQKSDRINQTLEELNNESGKNKPDHNEA
ncbi:MAG TPA: 30S ribosome-binding factor RbfA [Candidatus Omnitrophota bacterium]|nr:30S ribosome-binding factor RbfA [Candidatus Omnitrophota bacterium]